MSDNSLKKCSANETSACCCVDVGTIIDNEDCTAHVELVFVTENDASEHLNQLTRRARDIESDACQIVSKIDNVADGIKLTASFTFACEAENLIFQLGLR